MTDVIVDLRKSGKNFALLANSYSTDNIKQLPNHNLPNKFRSELNVVHQYLFGQELPSGEEDFSFLVKYNNGRFDKVYTPCVLKGNTENPQAPDPGSLYIRWGNNFAPLFAEEKKLKTSVSISLFMEKGEDAEPLSYSIISYGFNGDSYLDPAMRFSFIDEMGDSYTFHLPIKVKLQEVKEGGEKVDYTTQLESAFRRGLSAVTDLLLEAKLNGDASAKTYNLADLVPFKPYVITRASSKVSSSGINIVKLDVKGVGEIWCPQLFKQYVISGNCKASVDAPQVMVVGDSYTTAGKNGVNYTNFKVALSSDDMRVDYVTAYSSLESIGKEEFNAFLAETKSVILEKYQYAPTYNDRDLDLNINYKLVGYTVRDTQTGNRVYKLNIVDPRDNRTMEMWCPTSLIPTINQKPVITAETPSMLRVISKNMKGDRMYANSQIILNQEALEDAIDLNF